MPLTYKSDLDTLPFDLHAKIQVRTSVRLAVRVVTDTQTDTQTDDVKTITPDTSQTWGVIIVFANALLLLAQCSITSTLALCQIKNKEKYAYA